MLSSMCLYFYWVTQSALNDYLAIKDKASHCFPLFLHIWYFYHFSIIIAHFIHILFYHHDPHVCSRLYSSVMFVALTNTLTHHSASFLIDWSLFSNSFTKNGLLKTIFPEFLNVQNVCLQTLYLRTVWLKIKYLAHIFFPWLSCRYCFSVFCSRIMLQSCMKPV